ncbi:ABC transporter thiamine pyrophosphate-binding lipoprotein p37/Cypl [Mycoplasma bradburyae]|uniref:DNA repair protein n=1 Tax=Mycoplasma bradburyae TaxID=2963128 RepID=A0ABT5GCC6_9MOLU|nr:DNA repair protein [Mycoplasma bradburyae]MDC4182115.1 DNA repair protein [Mycoplasma bradburyae]UTS70316.1 DNA repair protein [Mycoplasma bradburyae]
MFKTTTKLFLAISSFLFCSSFVASCYDSKKDEALTLRLDLKIDHDSNSVLPNYLKKLADKVTEKTNKKVNVVSSLTSDGNTSVDRVKSNLTDLAFVSSSSIKKSDVQTVPKLQTLTRAFKYDNSPDFYEANTLGDKAKKTSDLFNEIAYKDWTDQNRMWDGNKYEYFYGPANDLISFYRGMILIGGDETTLMGIKKAWTEKNWDAFSAFGIGGGKMSSNGKYIYPMNLLKKHFNNKSLTIPNYQSVKGREIGNNKEVHIVFDDMNSFAWTQNKNKTTPYYTFDVSKPEEKVEILYFTDPALYDIGIFNNRLPSDIINALSESIVELAKNNEDPYGPTVGYNGYRVINDANTEVYQFQDKAKVN